MQVLLTVAAVAGWAAAQPAEEWKIVSDVRLVVVDVSVRDREGQPVAGIPREAFRVFDNGAPRKIASFAPEDAPATIGLAVDCSGSMRRKRTEVLLAASALLEESNPQDELFLTTFNDVVRTGPIAAAGSIRSALAGSVVEGRTALYDGIREAVEKLAQGTRARKALVVISDGADNASRSRRSDVEHIVQLTGATLYTIGILDESETDRSPALLRQLAAFTGGTSHIDIPPGQLVTVCQKIARDIRSRYSLAFYAAPAEREETRRIRIEVASMPHARIGARKAYIATPSPGGTAR